MVFISCLGFVLKDVVKVIFALAKEVGEDEGEESGEFFEVVLKRRSCEKEAKGGRDAH